MYTGTGLHLQGSFHLSVAYSSDFWSCAPFKNRLASRGDTVFSKLKARNEFWVTEQHGSNLSWLILRGYCSHVSDMHSGELPRPTPQHSLSPAAHWRMRKPTCAHQKSSPVILRVIVAMRIGQDFWQTRAVDPITLRFCKLGEKAWFDLLTEVSHRPFEYSIQYCWEQTCVCRRTTSVQLQVKAKLADHHCL